MKSSTKTKRKTEITVETERVLIVRRGSHGAAGWCEPCHQHVKLVTAEMAAEIIGVSRRTIYRWVEAQKVHFTETPANGLLICLNSLDESRQENNR